jgi:putative phosphoribosyl transferase
MRKLQSLFYHRVDAGIHLARALRPLIEAQKNIRIQSDVVIVAIPRGGVIIGDAIASKLGAKLDIAVTRKIPSPENPELAIGAVMPDGNYFLVDMIDAFSVSKYYIEQQTKAQLNEIQRRLISYRGTTSYDKEFDNKIIVLVDDGIATGATLIACAHWIKSIFNFKKLIITVPVAPPQILDDLKNLTDEVIIPFTPDPFMAVGRFYEIFDQVSDDQVKEIMKKYGYHPRDKAC